MYKCGICGTDVASVKSYINHCRVHANLPKLRLPCCFKSCCKTVTSYSGLRQHIGRAHGKIRQTNALAKLNELGTELKCSVVYCTYECSNTSQLIRHLKQHIDEGSRVECPLIGCQKSYCVKSSFTCHLSRDHISWALSDLKNAVQVVANEGCDVQSRNVVDLQDEVDDAETGYTAKDLNVLQQNFTQNLSLFFVKMSAQHLIPDNTVSTMVHELQNINALNQLHIKECVRQVLDHSGVADETSCAIVQAMDEVDLVKQCLDEGGVLHSTAKRSAFVRRNSAYVKPQSIYVGTDGRNKCRYAYYVPIRQSLEALMMDKSVMQQCLSVRFSNDSVLRDFTDGAVYKRKFRTAADKKYLTLILYQDSFEVVNPLGSAKKKHKILGFYYVIGNLEPHNRSSIDNVQLILLALESDVNRIGHKIFNRLVSDLQALESEGIENEGHNFIVGVAAIAGDNLGSHWLGGFVTSFSGKSSTCRFCLSSKEEMTGNLDMVEIPRVRTAETYDLSVAKLSTGDASIVEGIKFESVFNKLKTFHVCDPGLPPCIAHDVFEGVVAYDLPLFMRYFTKAKDRHKLFTVQRLNKRLECFDFAGSDAKVKPPLVPLSLERLTGSASQNWCFLRIFPLLVFGLVDPEDDAYDALMLLRTVVELVMAPAISYGEVAYMRVVIDDYIDRRRALFPHVPLRPKHHFLSHYAMLTLQFGPLVRLWTLRFESKHQYFKRCVRRSRNFINVAKMLASRHQLQQAYLSAGIRFEQQCISSDTVTVCEMILPSEVRDFVNCHGLSKEQACSEVTVKGTLYRKGLVLPIQAHHSTKSIIFGEILFFVVSPTVQVMVNVRPSSYNFVCGGYVLHDISELKCLPLSSFADYYPLGIYKLDCESVVLLRHHLLDADD